MMDMLVAGIGNGVRCGGFNGFESGDRPDLSLFKDKFAYR